MPSPYPKFLWPVTIDSSCDSFATSLGTATIASGDYASILEVLAELEDKLQAIDATFAVTLSSLGILSIACDNPWTWTTGSTDDALSLLLGLDEAVDAVSSNVLTASNQHRKGWYPGLLSFTRAIGRGGGPVVDERWRPIWEGNRLFTMSGKSSTCMPTSSLAQRDITIKPMHKDEIDDANIGVRGFIDECIASTFRWYPDRTLGVVNTPGTQNMDYFKCSFVEPGGPEWRKSGRHPDWFELPLLLNQEPTS